MEMSDSNDGKTTVTMTIDEYERLKKKANPLMTVGESRYGYYARKNSGIESCINCGLMFLMVLLLFMIGVTLRSMIG